MYAPRWEFKHGGGWNGYLGGDGGGGGGGFGGGDNAGGYGDGWGDGSDGGYGGYGGNTGGDGGTGYGGDSFGYGDQPGDYDMPSNDPTAGWASEGLADFWGSEFATPANSYGDFQSQFGDYAYAHDPGKYSGMVGDSNSTNDIFARIQKFMTTLGMKKALSTVSQNSPVLGQIASIAAPVAMNPNPNTPIGQQIAGSMVDAIASPVQGPVQAAIGLANLFGANINLPTVGRSLANANLSYGGVGEGMGGISGALGSGEKGGNSWIDSLMNGAATGAGLYSMYKNYDAANRQANNLSSMFSPNSPYAKQLEQQLARRDAASGRRSQYGPRSVELQAKLAAMANQIAPNVLAARQNGSQNLMQMLGMLTSANKMGVFDYPKSWLNDMFSNSTTYTPTSNDMSGLYSGDSYGDWGLGGD